MLTIDEMLNNNNINDINIESVKLINHELILNLGLASITILSLK